MVASSLIFSNLQKTSLKRAHVTTSNSLVHRHLKFYEILNRGKKYKKKMGTSKKWEKQNKNSTIRYLTMFQELDVNIKNYSYIKIFKSVSNNFSQAVSRRP
jgi:hypothetical protein